MKRIHLQRIHKVLYIVQKGIARVLKAWPEKKLRPERQRIINPRQTFELYGSGIQRLYMYGNNNKEKEIHRIKKTVIHPV